MNPETAFQKVLREKVFPAMERGINLQVTTGMVERREPDNQSGSKPRTVPGWMTLLDGLFGEAPMRFLSLVQFLPNLRDPYWQAPIRSEKPGACFAIPLGQGHAFTAGDMQVAEEVQSAVCGRSLHVISMQRTRLTRRKGGQPMQDGVPLEAYSLSGELVWRNPFKSLDDAIQEAEALMQNPGYTPAAQEAPQAMVPVAPLSAPAPVQAPAPGPASEKSEKTAQILSLQKKYGTSKTGDDLIALISRMTGVPAAGVKVVLKANQQEDPRAQQVRDAASQLADLNLEQELLTEAISDMTGLPQDLIMQVLSGKTAQAAPMAPAHPPVAAQPRERKPAPQPEEAPETPAHPAQGTAHALGLGIPAPAVPEAAAPKAKAPRVKANHDPAPLGAEVTFQDFQTKQPQIKERVLDYIRKTSRQGASPAELRKMLGIPEGSQGEPGRLAAALKRNILTPLCEDGLLVQEGSTRGVFYILTTDETKG